jgi:hypothetical protein
MTSNYKAYLEYLASFADSHTLAIQAETNIYPLFADIKNLISHYNNTIEKFPTVQNDLIKFIERLQYDESDFDYYQNRFIALRQVDTYLQELKTKKVSSSLANEIRNFITTTYSSASLYDVDKLEQKVLSYHNKAAEAARQNEKQTATMKTLLTIAAVVIFIMFLISKCNH